MRYVDEYRDGEIAAGIARRVAETATRPWVLMEVCGGQTHSIVRYGLDRMLPPEVMDGWLTDLRGSVMLPGAGHWTQQERPDEVNAALIEFVRAHATHA